MYCGAFKVSVGYCPLAHSLCQNKWAIFLLAKGQRGEERFTELVNYGRLLALIREVICKQTALLNEVMLNEAILHTV